MKKYSRLLKKLKPLTDEPEAEARILWQDLGGNWPPGVGTQPNDSALEFVLKLRKLKFPLAYITGLAYFFGRPFFVLPGVFIPRLETETVYLTFKEFFSIPDKNLFVADVGTGTGCIAITVALEYSKTRIVAIDVSKIALQNTDFNRRMWKVSDRVHLILGNGVSPLKENSIDSVIINPPYIPTSKLCFLPEEVRYEPVVALDGGVDGLQYLRELLPQIQKVLKNKGLVFMEISLDIQDSLIQLAKRLGYSITGKKHDLAKSIAVIVLRKEA